MTCMKTSEMAITSSPCWKSSQETAWYVSVSAFLPSFLRAFPFDPLTQCPAPSLTFSSLLGLSPSPASSNPNCSFLAEALAL